MLGLTPGFWTSRLKICVTSSEGEISWDLSRTEIYWNELKWRQLGLDNHYTFHRRYGLIHYIIPSIMIYSKLDTVTQMCAIMELLERTAVGFCKIWVCNDICSFFLGDVTDSLLWILGHVCRCFQIDWSSTEVQLKDRSTNDVRLTLCKQIVQTLRIS